MNLLTINISLFGFFCERKKKRKTNKQKLSKIKNYFPKIKINKFFGGQHKKSFYIFIKEKYLLLIN